MQIKEKGRTEEKKKDSTDELFFFNRSLKYRSHIKLFEYIK